MKLPVALLGAALLSAAPFLAADEPAACCVPVAPAVPLSELSLYQLDATFTDDRGESFALTQLRGRPVVLTMFFASCGHACPMLVTDMARIRDGLPAAIRDDVALVLVTFDTMRDTPEALHAYRTQRHLDGQWVLLHGSDDAVSELAALLGVKYKRERDGMFSHSNLITVLDREGEIVHRRDGLNGGLEETSAAVARAAEGG